MLTLDSCFDIIKVVFLFVHFVFWRGPMKVQRSFSTSTSTVFFQKVERHRMEIYGQFNQ